MVRGEASCEFAENFREGEQGRSPGYSQSPQAGHISTTSAEKLHQSPPGLSSAVLGGGTLGDLHNCRADVCASSSYPAALTPALTHCHLPAEKSFPSPNHASPDLH